MNEEKSRPIVKLKPPRGFLKRKILEKYHEDPCRPTSEIALIAGCSPKTVTDCIRDAGLPARRAVIARRVIEEHKNNPSRSAEEIALAVGCTRHFVGSCLRILKLNAANRVHWVPEMEACLKNGITSNKSIHQMCAEIGVAPYAIACRLLKMAREHL